MLSFRLVDSGWSKELDDALASHSSEIRVICPFIKKRIAKRLLRHGKPALMQVITRFCLGDFCSCVSDVDALSMLLENGARIRGVRNLHSKVYLFGKSNVIVTSANLTESALSRNHEFGFVAQDAAIVDGCVKYFEDLWARAGNDLTISQLENWRATITSYLAIGAGSRTLPSLGDEGAYVGLPSEPIVFSPWAADVEQAFVKFFGNSETRVDRSTSVLEEVRRSGCHWACTYGKPPRQVMDGAILFVSRLVRNPDDILVYGRAVGMKHLPGRDEASPEEIQERPWKDNWPYYIRVHHTEFVDGTLWNGISLNEMMETLKSDAYASTSRNALAGGGRNVDPRKAYLRQPAVELSAHGMEWLNQHIENAFASHGKIAPAVLAELDWPSLMSGGNA